MQNSQANTDYYNEVSKIYDSKHQIDLKDYPYFVRHLNKLVKAGTIRKNSRVLDCGCGTGRGALKFCRLGCRVTAIDISDKIVKICEKNARKYGFRIRTKAEDCRRLSFEDGSFDYVTASAALHHMEDLEQCLGELYRVTKKGGALLLFGEPKKSILRPKWIRDIKERLSAEYDLKATGVRPVEQNPDVHIFDVNELKALLAKVGYTNIETTEFFALSSLYRDLLFFRIKNQRVRRSLLEFFRFIDERLLFWLPKRFFALFNLVAWKAGD